MPVVIYTIFALAAAICSFTVLPSLRLHLEFSQSIAKTRLASRLLNCYERSSRLVKNSLSLAGRALKIPGGVSDASSRLPQVG
jgi:hypothetical protein